MARISASASISLREDRSARVSAAQLRQLIAQVIDIANAKLAFV
jgi:hypothetical protein